MMLKDYIKYLIISIIITIIKTKEPFGAEADKT